MTLGNERTAWTSGMIVGFLFGALAILGYNLVPWLGLAVLLGWLYVLLGYLKLSWDGFYEGPDEMLDIQPYEEYRREHFSAERLLHDAIHREEHGPMDDLWLPGHPDDYGDR